MRQLRALVGLMVLVAGCMAMAGAEDTTPGRVNAEKVNVRSGPALSDRVVGTVKQGDIVQVVGLKNGWYEIQYPAGCYMWTSAKYVKVDEPAGNGWGDGVKGSISGSKVRIRVSPDLKAAIIREAEYKETVTVLGKTGDWYFLKPDTDLHAYVASSLVDLEKVEPKVEPKVKPTAEQSVNAKPVVPAAVLSVAVTQVEKAPEITPVGEEATKVSDMQKQAGKRIQESGATYSGVVARVPAASEAETGCSYKLVVGGITVKYLRSATVSLDKFVAQKVTIHGSLGAKASGRDQQIINVEFVEAVQE